MDPKEGAKSAQCQKYPYLFQKSRKQFDRLTIIDNRQIIASPKTMSGSVRDLGEDVREKKT